ncbi:TPA: type III secretion protein [Pseudomonas putida]
MRNLFWLTGLLLVVLSLPARSDDSEPAWFAQPYAYALVDQDLRGALSEFGQNLEQVVVVSDKVRGKARSPLRSNTAGEFLTQLCDSNALGWYYDGSVLYVYSNDEVATRLFRRQPGLDLEQLRDYLQSLDVHGRQLSMRPGAERDELLVSGPPAYLNMIQQHLDNRPQAVATSAPSRGIRVFRGANVSDH